MDFGLAFTFVFKDPDWLKKVALTALIFLIPIIGQIYALGWGLEITRRIINGDPSPLLPDVDFGSHLALGFKGFVIGLVFSIPAMIFQLPTTVLGTIANQGGMDENTMALVVSIVSVCCGGLSFIYSLALSYFLPAAYGNMVAKGSLGAGFKFSEIFALIKAAPVPYLIVLGGIIVAGIVASLGVIACVIGVIFTAAYSFAVESHFYGQAYRQATAPKY